MKTDGSREQLLAYIDIPYFKNNPGYVDMWRKLYSRSKDPQILLLMFHKQISTHYHWIYIEMSNYFLKINKPELAHHIVSYAIKNEVYDQKKLQGALSKIPPFDRQYCVGDMECILNQKNIAAVGRIWNKYDEKFIYERHLSGGAVNYEYLRMQNAYSGKHESWSCLHSQQRYIRTEELSCIFKALCVINNPNCEQTGISTSTNQNSSKSSACVEDWMCCQKTAAEEIHDNHKKIKVNSTENTMELEEATNIITNDYPTKEQQDATENMMSLTTKIHDIGPIGGPGKEIVVNDIIYVIQEIHPEYITALGLAKNSNISETISVKTCFIMGLPEKSVALLSKCKDYEFWQSENNYYLPLQFDLLCKFEEALRHCDRHSFSFYLFQILEILDTFVPHGLCPSSLDFAVDNEFKLHLFDYKMTPANDESMNSIKNQLRDLCTKYEVSFQDSLANLKQSISESLSTREYKKGIIKHKAQLLNAL
ncbi:hypothetical protein ENBRE01_0262 [Enteropsectra breve]|nr:hypothetical protein ENBRE01_0262 [Enteropsectra breve]